MVDVIAINIGFCMVKRPIILLSIGRMIENGSRTTHNERIVCVSLRVSIGE